MPIKEWDMREELQTVVESYKAEIPSFLKSQLEEQLQKLGGFDLDTNLFDLVANYPESEAYQAILTLSEDKEDETSTEEEILTQAIRLVEMEENPDLALERTIDDEINEIKFEYARKIAPYKLYIPVHEWDKAAIAYYCVQCNYNPTVRQLLPFLFESKRHFTLFAFEDLVAALEEFNKGISDAYDLSDLLKEKNLSNEDYKKTKSFSANDVDELLKVIKGALTNTLIEKNHETNRSNSAIPYDLTYFELSADYNKLKTFKSELTVLCYISKEVTTEEFRRVFLFQDDPLKERLKQQALQPITWLKNKSHLGYLIKQLAKHDIIQRKDYYKIAENCFLYEGALIKNSVFHGMQLPAFATKRKIDKIVIALK